MQGGLPTDIGSHPNASGADGDTSNAGVQVGDQPGIGEQNAEPLSSDAQNEKPAGSEAQVTEPVGPEEQSPQPANTEQLNELNNSAPSESSTPESEQPSGQESAANENLQQGQQRDGSEEDTTPNSTTEQGEVTALNQQANSKRQDSLPDAKGQSGAKTLVDPGDDVRERAKANKPDVLFANKKPAKPGNDAVDTSVSNIFVSDTEYGRPLTFGLWPSDYLGYLQAKRGTVSCRYEDLFTSDYIPTAIRNADSYVLLSAPKGVSLTKDGILTINPSKLTSNDFAHVFVVKVKVLSNGKPFIHKLLIQDYGFAMPGGWKSLHPIRLIAGYDSIKAVPRREAFDDRNPAGTNKYRKLSGSKGISVSQTGDVSIEPGLPAGTYPVSVEVTSGDQSAIVTLETTVEPKAPKREKAESKPDASKSALAKSAVGSTAGPSESTPAPSSDSKGATEKDTPVLPIAAALVALASALGIVFAKRTIMPR